MTSIGTSSVNLERQHVRPRAVTSNQSQYGRMQEPRSSSRPAPPITPVGSFLCRHVRPETFPT